MPLTAFMLFAAHVFAAVPAASPASLEVALGSPGAERIVEGTRNLAQRIERESLRLTGEDRLAWIRLIIEAGRKGVFFNPNLPEAKLAKGLSFGAEPDVKVFAAFGPDRGRAWVLIYQSDCDFIARLNDARGACRDAKYTAFVASDEGVPLLGYRSGQEAPLPLEDPAVLADFMTLRAKLVAEGRKLPDP